MRRLFLTGFLALAGMGLFAQSVDKAKDLLKANKIADAKTQIDGALAVEKNQKSPDAWYYKLKIYNAIAAGPLAAQYPDARQQAFEALKKYVEVDDKKLLLLQIDGYKPVNEIYQGFFQIGANDYNAAKYDSALTNFNGAIETSSFMNSKGWTTLKLDTTSTLYAGISAEKAGKKDTAAIYYGRLADAKIDKINNSNMIDIYKWLVDYYNNTKKDEAMTQKYLGIAEKIFPDDLFWPSTRLEILRAKGNKDSLFVEYDTIVAHFPKNYLFFFNFGLELYQYASDTSSGQRPANADTLIAKAQVMLKSCLALQPDYPQAALVMGQISYNQGVDLQAQTKKIPGKGPDDIKKRADLRIAAGKKFDEAIPYFEKVDQDLGSKGKLKMEEKSALKDAYDLLITIYETKNVKEKADAYTTKYNNVDKDH
jgi:tetratricopeptide (TPR) repeat protein